MSDDISSPKRFVFHLLPNAHLDPVWLWDWREGLNEGLTTVRTILDMMDEFPQLTFIRGESLVYEHIEKTDPKTFERLGRMIETGRWDVVGGTYNQPDTNLAATETLCRQYERGLTYFQSRFGLVPRIAWQADSFGHTPGLPHVLRSFGMEGFAFTRPDRSDFPLAEPAFWWNAGRDRILCYRQYFVAYCSERHNLSHVLNLSLEGAQSHPFRHVGVLMGLGNHGGGPSRRHIADAASWAAAHPEVELRFSTLHRFFGALEDELEECQHALPEVTGDLGFCLRGCYSSVMKLKGAYRRSEALLVEAETTAAIIGATLEVPCKPLVEAWDSVLFNSFHDILPGSSIERGLDDQISLTGLASHRAREAQFAALNQLALEMNTSVSPAPHEDRPADVPVLVWNPLPRIFRGQVELEVSLDYRPLQDGTGKIGDTPLSLIGPAGDRPPFQEIATEHTAMRNLTWRKRIVTTLELPPLGWKVYRFGCRDTGEQTKLSSSPCLGSNGCISSSDWKVEVTSGAQLQISHLGKIFGGGPLSLRTEEDPWGSWGKMFKESDPYSAEPIRHEWRIAEHAILENGPERATLWTRWEGGASWLDLTFQVSTDLRKVAVKGRLLWNERSARLKLILPSCGQLEMQVPAGQAVRGQHGSLPCGRWFRRGIGENSLGFLSDVLSDVEATDTETGVTLARASRYADDHPTRSDEARWIPAVDNGELKFEFWLAPRECDLEALSRELLHPPVALCVPPHPGSRPDHGSLAHIEPAELNLLSIQKREDGLQVRLQNSTAYSTEAAIIIGEKRFELGTLEAGEIHTAFLSRP